jgi:hypothetical protein
MGAIDQVNKIKRELAQLDLEQSACPVDRRRAEKEAERKAIATREVEQSQQTTNWARWIDERIEEHLRRYFMSGDEANPGLLTEAIGRVMGENRALARKELKAAVEDAEKRLAEKLAELEERWKSAAAAFPIVKSSCNRKAWSTKASLLPTEARSSKHDATPRENPDSAQTGLSLRAMAAMRPRRASAARSTA